MLQWYFSSEGENHFEIITQIAGWRTTSGCSRSVMVLQVPKDEIQCKMYAISNENCVNAWRVCVTICECLESSYAHLIVNMPLDG